MRKVNFTFHSSDPSNEDDDEEEGRTDLDDQDCYIDGEVQPDGEHEVDSKEPCMR